MHPLEEQSEPSPDHAACAPIGVTVNGQAQSVPPGASLADLLARLGHAPDSVATAVNGNFVARHQRAGCTLHAGDQVTCFQPIVGG